jgi:hypothetical protein
MFDELLEVGHENTLDVLGFGEESDGLGVTVAACWVGSEEWQGIPDAQRMITHPCRHGTI